jgi:hypothetical protein
VDIAVGVVLVVLGAVAATVTSRELDERGHGRAVAPALMPFGVLIGAGAALVRGWEPIPSAVAGLVLLPAVALASRVWLARRSRG